MLFYLLFQMSCWQRRKNTRASAKSWTPHSPSLLASKLRLPTLPSPDWLILCYYVTNSLSSSTLGLHQISCCTSFHIIDVSNFLTLLISHILTQFLNVFCQRRSDIVTSKISTGHHNMF